jgi:hypothetical protein
LGKYQGAAGQKTCNFCPAFGAKNVKMEQLASEFSRLQVSIDSSFTGVQTAIRNEITAVRNNILTLNGQIKDDEARIYSLQHKTFWDELKVGLEILTGLVMMCVPGLQGFGALEFAHDVYDVYSITKDTVDAVHDGNTVSGLKANIAVDRSQITALQAVLPDLKATNDFLSSHASINERLDTCVTTSPCAMHVDKVLPLLAVDKVAASNVTRYLSSAKAKLGDTSDLDTYASDVQQQISILTQWYGSALSQGASSTVPAASSPPAPASVATCPASTGPVTPTACADDGGTCACNGTVVYGASDTWVSLPDVRGAVGCSKTVFPHYTGSGAASCKCFTEYAQLCSSGMCATTHGTPNCAVYTNSGTALSECTSRCNLDPTCKGFMLDGTECCLVATEGVQSLAENVISPTPTQPAAPFPLFYVAVGNPTVQVEAGTGTCANPTDPVPCFSWNNKMWAGSACSADEHSTECGCSVCTACPPATPAPSFPCTCPAGGWGSDDPDDALVLQSGPSLRPRNQDTTSVPVSTTTAAVAAAVCLTLALASMMYFRRHRRAAQDTIVAETEMQQNPGIDNAGPPVPVDDASAL